MKSVLGLSILSLLLVMIALVSTSAVAQEEESSLDFDLRTVATLTAAGSYADALSLATELATEHPDSLEAHIVLQDLKIAAGDTKEMVKDYAARAGKAGAAPDALYLHARLLEGSKRLNLLKKAQRVDPKHFQVLCALGVHYIDIEKLSDAENCLLAATQVRRSSPAPWNCLGHLEEKRGDAARAEECYRKAIELDPKDAVAYLNLGTLLITDLKFEEAEAALKAAATCAPSSPMPLLGRGMLLMAKARQPKPKEEEAAADDPDAPDDPEEGDGAPADPKPDPAQPDPEVDPESFGKDGDGTAKDGGAAAGADDQDPDQKAEEEETVRSLFEAAVQMKSNTFTSLNMLGLAYSNLWEFGRSKKAFSRALALNKEHPLTYINLCHMALEMGQPEQALSWVMQATRLDGASPQAYYFTGVCESALGKNRAAEAAFLKATKLDEENSLYWRTLGTHYAGLGKWAEAVRIFSKAIDLMGETVELQIDLAFAYSGAGNFARAVDLFEQAVAADPTQLTAWMNLGLLYKEKLRNSQKATEAFTSYLDNGGKDKRVKDWLAEVQRQKQ